MGGGGGGPRVKHLESALKHAREGKQANRTAAAGVDAPEVEHMPPELLASLADVERQAILELLRAHAKSGNSAKAAHLREEFRSLLPPRGMDLRSS